MRPKLRKLKKWRSQQAEDLKVYSRRQLLEALIPEAGKSSKSKNVKNIEGESKAKSKARCNTQQDLCGGRPLEIINFLLLTPVYYCSGDPSRGG